MTVAAMRIIVDRDQRAVAAAPREVAPRPRLRRRSPWSASRAGSRSRPCPRRARAGRPPGRRRWRPGRSPARTRAAATLRQARYVDGVSPSSRAASHDAERGVVVVEPVARLAEAEEGRGGDRRVVEADDAAVAHRRVAELAGARAPRPRRRAGRGRPRGDRRPVRDGSGPRGAVGGGASSIGADDTRLRPMCGRFTQQRPASELAEIFAAEPLADELGPRFNVAPTDDAFVVVQREERRAITAYRWGLVPHWSTDLKAGSRMFNARAETITTEPGLPGGLPATALPRPGRLVLRVEARGHGPPAVRDRPRRRPPARRWPACGPAGATRSDRGGVRRTFTIVTTTPNDAMADLHDRMPVVVPDDAWERWLDPSAGGSAASCSPCSSRPTRSRCDIYPVERLVNNVRNDGPELLAPLASPTRRRAGRGRARAGPLDRRPGRRTPRAKASAGVGPGIDRRRVPADRRRDSRSPTHRRRAPGHRPAASPAVVRVGPSVGRASTTRWALAQAAARPASARTRRARVGRRR